MLALDVIRQAFQDVVQLARLLTRIDGRAVEHGEGIGELGERGGEALALGHPCTNRQRNALGFRLFALLADGGERFVQGQAGAP